MIHLRELSDRLKPDRTVLFLGAGASASSGAPLASALAERLSVSTTGHAASSDDLAEQCGILEMKVGRLALVQALRECLASLKPTGGLLALPFHSWAAIYTTNFDTLVEKAYQAANVPLVVVRSNFDYRKVGASAGVPLFKIHGCLSQDLVDGHESRLVLTERDSDEYHQYRQVLFNQLQLDLAAKDVLIVGHSLRDNHLRRAIKEAAELKRNAGAPGRIYVLVYERDEDRAALLESNNVTTAFGSIDDLLTALTSNNSMVTATPIAAPQGFWPQNLIPRIVDIAHAAGLPASPDRMYAGSHASYADVRQGYTFQRSAEHRLLDALRKDTLLLALTGVAGCGKTTLARRIAIAAHDLGIPSCELRFGSALDARHWLEFASRLPPDAPLCLLVIDDCPDQLRQLNLLLDGLAELGAPRLRVVVTAQTSQWAPRTKSPRLFRFGVIEELNSLDEGEVDRLLDLVDQTPAIRSLVDPRFLEKGRRQRSELLRRRCAADMFVALKYLFSIDAIDTIILREYAGISEEVQNVYRVVASLEAAGARVHRQLVIRLLNVRADLLPSHLAILEGLVEEFDIDPRNGLYGWRTRHEVIAAIIAKYKLADEKQLARLIEDVIDSLNPTLFLERATASSLCTSDYGIRRIGSAGTRQALYQKMISVAPSERVPRHRLIREYLDAGRINDAEHAITSAEKVVGLDSPMRRYKVLVLIARASETDGIMLEDRLALLSEARRSAFDAIRASREDKYSYDALAKVGDAKYALVGELDYLDEALETMRAGYEMILDPGLQKTLDEWERRRLAMHPRTKPLELDHA